MIYSKGQEAKELSIYGRPVRNVYIRGELAFSAPLMSFGVSDKEVCTELENTLVARKRFSPIRIDGRGKYVHVIVPKYYKPRFYLNGMRCTPQENELENFTDYCFGYQNGAVTIEGR